MTILPRCTLQKNKTQSEDETIVHRMYQLIFCKSSTSITYLRFPKQQKLLIINISDRNDSPHQRQVNGGSPETIRLKFCTASVFLGIDFTD